MPIEKWLHKKISLSCISPLSCLLELAVTREKLQKTALHNPLWCTSNFGNQHFFFLFLTFWLYLTSMEDLSSSIRESNPCPLQWKHRAWTAREVNIVLKWKSTLFLNKRQGLPRHWQGSYGVLNLQREAQKTQTRDKGESQLAGRTELWCTTYKGPQDQLLTQPRA